jgi:hypothetical protein
MPYAFLIEPDTGHACVPCLRRSGYAQAGGTHFGVQARSRYFKKYAIL